MHLLSIYPMFQIGDSNPGRPWTRPDPTRPSAAPCYPRRSTSGPCDENSNFSDWLRCRRESRRGCLPRTPSACPPTSRSPDPRSAWVWWCRPERLPSNCYSDSSIYQLWNLLLTLKQFTECITNLDNLSLVCCFGSGHKLHFDSKAFLFSLQKWPNNNYQSYNYYQRSTKICSVF